MKRTQSDKVERVASPRCMTVEEAAKEGNGSRSSYYKAIKEGRLKARKLGRRTIILDSEHRLFLESLPDALESRGAA